MIFKQFSIQGYILKTLGVCVSSIFLLACAHQQASSHKLVLTESQCQVNPQIERKAIPKTPQNMNLPEFGQGIIGWGTGSDGAKKRIENIKKEHLASIQDQGTTLAMIQEWQAFYENEVQRNPCNPTAAYRAALMKKIVGLWGN